MTSKALKNQAVKSRAPIYKTEPPYKDTAEDREATLAASMPEIHSQAKWKLNGRYGDLKDEIISGSRAVATVWTRKNVPTDGANGKRSAVAVDDPVGQANFKLILAAPALLSAAHAALQELLLDENDHDDSVIAELRAAIAEATT